MSNPLYISRLAVWIKSLPQKLLPSPDAFSLSRWWQHLGFGIQSRTDYDFLHEVILEKSPYYIYKDMRTLFPEASDREQRLAQLLFRLGNHIHPTDIIYGGTPSQLNKHALSSTVTKDVTPSSIVFVQGEETGGIDSQLWTSSLIVITDIKNTNNQLWQKILAHEHTITFDKHGLGIAIIDRKRFSEHYAI